MTAQFKDFKEMAKNKKLKLFGGKKLNISAQSLSNFVKQVKENKLNEAKEKYNKVSEQLNMKKLGLRHEMEKGTLTEGLKQRYENEIAFLESRVQKWEKRINKLNKDDIVLEYETSSIRNFFPNKLNEKEAERLQSYFDKESKTFKIAGEEFDPNVDEYEKAEVYSRIIDKFRDTEEDLEVKTARSLEAYGNTVYGNDFMRLFTAHTKEKQAHLRLQLFDVYTSLASQIGERKMRKYNNMKNKKLERVLSKLNLLNLREDILSFEKEKPALPPAREEVIEENKVEEKTNMEEKPNKKEDKIEEKAIEAKTLKDLNTLEMEEYEYKVALEEARRHLEEIETTEYTFPDGKKQTLQDRINTLRAKYIMESEKHAQAFGVFDGDVKQENYDALAREIEPLRKQIDDARENVRKAEDAYRAVSSELRKRKSMELKEKRKLQDAKDFLSKIQYGTLKYDTSKWSDEEIIEKAEKIQNEMNTAQTIANEREEKQEKVPTYDEKKEVINNLMETAGLTKEQATNVANSGSQVIQNVLNEFYVPKAEAKGKTL